MSTHNIGFCEEIIKLGIWISYLQFNVELTEKLPENKHVLILDTKIVIYCTKMF